MPGALEGLRVLDLTRLLPGAVATEWLAQVGAEVIKIEQPPLGDYARASYTALFEETNRGKKSIELDLKSQKESFLKLVRGADVVIEGFRPGVMERLGLGYDVLREANPRLIYVAMTGYGSDGPHALLAGHDVNYLAMSGVLDLIRAEDGTPVIPGVQIADLAGGSMQAVIGILLAMEARHKSGQGQRVNVSMTDGLNVLLPVARAKGPVKLLNGSYACYRVYAAAGDSYVAVGALEPKFWVNLCKELGCEELIDRQFAGDQARVIAVLAGKFKVATAEEWFSRIGDKDCCVTPVRMAAHGAAPQSQSQGKLGRAPRLGEHNGELL
ncbi:MAG TPA: CaiB/BaiF CoA-transferase family protein [Bryobacteraceae bacterium]|jgi:crotonobetainyl-CoA:carnitine CoA-transferase CaiB-like acyl-CoA transferase|nr:CaiB/BaiF CoA-transferase family protein [Bryobacteraceae bacterium]